MTIALVGCGAGLGEAGDGGDDETAEGADQAEADAAEATGDGDEECGPFVPGPVAWSPCGGLGECGVLEVPRDWAEPCGPMTPIFVRRIAASDPAQRIGAILVNPGGPGAGGAGLASFVYLWVGAELRARFDIVGFDPRGTGNSARIDCGYPGDLLREGDNSPDDRAELADLRARQRAFAEACGANAGPLLAHVGTDATVRDMDAIRELLGDEAISYVGYSYGTLLGARYADRYPERVRAFVLDGAVDPALAMPELVIEQAAGFERALESFLAACGADPGCDFHNGGDPFTAFDALMAEIDQAPLPTDVAGIWLGPADAELGVIGSLYAAGSWPALAKALAAAQSGEGQALYELADGYSGGAIFDAYAAIKCIDEPAPSPAEFDAIDAVVSAQSPRIGRALSYEYQFCAFWPVAPTGQPAPVAAKGAGPIVVVGTTGDPATPWAWSAALAEQLDEGVLVTYEGEGHTIVGRGVACIDEAIRAFLLDSSPPAAGLSCP